MVTASGCLSPPCSAPARYLGGGGTVPPLDSRVQRNLSCIPVGPTSIHWFTRIGSAYRRVAYLGGGGTPPWTGYSTEGPAGIASRNGRKLSLRCTTVVPTRHFRIPTWVAAARLRDSV